MNLGSRSRQPSVVPHDDSPPLKPLPPATLLSDLWHSSLAASEEPATALEWLSWGLDVRELELAATVQGFH
jgi:hypothetical protein